MCQRVILPTTTDLDGDGVSPARGVQLLYVRHGENLANILHQLSHKVVDYPLTDRGREQAELLARALADHVWSFDDEVVSSPARRARETADVIASKFGLRVRTDERLREIDVGTLDGRTDDDAWETYAEIHRRWAAGEWSSKFPAGENLRDLANRLRSALLGAAAEASRRSTADGGDTTPIVIVVGHGGGFRAALPCLVANVAAAYPRADMSNCSITHLQATPASGQTEIRLQDWGVPAPELHRLRLGG
jgi:broad specificity phosphatase PhoE